VSAASVVHYVFTVDCPLRRVSHVLDSTGWANRRISVALLRLLRLRALLRRVSRVSSHGCQFARRINVSRSVRGGLATHDGQIQGLQTARRRSPMVVKY
jgi:hypothetical protein